MRPIKQISRRLKKLIVESLADQLLRSGHFRRTVLRQLFLKHMAPGALGYVTFPDHVMVVDPRAHMIAFRLVEGNAWQRQELRRAIEITGDAGTLKPNGWCLDVGANICTQSLYALLSGRFRGVIAIEPEPHNAELLRRNIELNGFGDRVHVVEAAASAASGTAILARDPENFGAHTLEPQMRQRHADSVVVETRTIDEILSSLAIDPADVSLVLMDVEGHEIEALKGMPRLLRFNEPTATEITTAIHGAQGMERLRNLLLPDYRLVAPLPRRGSNETPEAGQRLAGFDFGLRQIDVLIYNRALTPAPRRNACRHSGIMPARAHHRRPRDQRR
jgi:FkbM family methyltransferase